VLFCGLALFAAGSMYQDMHAHATREASGADREVRGSKIEGLAPPRRPRARQTGGSDVPDAAFTDWGQVTAAIGLNHIGDMQLLQPEHLVCDSRLFFMERASKFADLSEPLQKGTIIGRVGDVHDENECCAHCMDEDCQGFRLESAICTLLDFGEIAHDPAPESDFAESMNARFFSEGKQRVKEEKMQDIQRNKEKLSGLRYNAQDEIEESNEREENEKEIDEIARDNHHQEEDDDNEEETENESVEDQEEEEEEEEDNGDGDVDDADLFSGLKSNQAKDNDDDEVQNLFAEIDLNEEDADLFQTDQNTGDQDAELLKSLMNEAEDRINPKPDSPEEIEAARQHEIAESLKESRLEDSENEEIGRVRIRAILPPGDYNRLTARDPIYGQNKNFFLKYRSQRDIMEVAKKLADYHKDAEFVKIGDTGDKKKPQNIMSLRVGNGRRGKHIFVIGTLRGCEWTSSMAILHTALAIKGRGESTKALLDAVQFHFIMIANPAGFDFSHLRTPSSARSWCKNRRVAVSGSHGVDLEHNWGMDGISWGFGKRLKDGAKLESFQGPANFSEPETQSLRNYMAHYASGRGRIAVAQIKCCSGIITPPQIYTQFENAINIQLIAERIAFQMEQTDGTKYSVTLRDKEFHAKNQGQLIDYTYNELGAELSFIWELKGSALSTRQDPTKIAIEPFNTLLRELETGITFIAQKLLLLPIQGEAVDVPYKALPTKPHPIVTASSSKRKRRKP